MFSGRSIPEFIYIESNRQIKNVQSWQLQEQLKAKAGFTRVRPYIGFGHFLEFGF